MVRGPVWTREVRIDAVAAEEARPGVSERTRVYFEISDYDGRIGPECSLLDPGMLDNKDTKHAVPLPDSYIRFMSEDTDPPVYLGWIPGFPPQIVTDVVKGLKC